jgi:uncharacterized FlaG/YvyC family protein
MALTTTFQPAAPLPPALSPVSVAEAGQRRQLLQAVKTVNESGTLGQNQLVFAVDRETHRPVIRVEDRTTHQVISQIPAEYLLQLAQNLGSSSEKMLGEEEET